MNERIKELEECCWEELGDEEGMYPVFNTKKFAELIAKDCIHYIETHRIPVGNSAAGEMACEWTYDALKSIRDEIKEHFEIKD